MKVISIRCDTLSLLHVCLLSSYRVYNAYLCLCIPPPNAQSVCNLHLICIFTSYRMEWDSNPRYAMHTSVFKTDTFDRSDIHPVYVCVNAQTHCVYNIYLHLHILYTQYICVYNLQCMYTDKGISIIWSLCVPYVANAQSVYNAYVCLCIPPPSAQSLYMCVHCVYNIFVVFAGIPLEAIRCLSLYSIALVR